MAVEVAATKYIEVSHVKKSSKAEIRFGERASRRTPQKSALRQKRLSTAGAAEMKANNGTFLT
jgi:hypothetical protein